MSAGLGLDLQNPHGWVDAPMGTHRTGGTARDAGSGSGKRSAVAPTPSRTSVPPNSRFLFLPNLTKVCGYVVQQDSLLSPLSLSTLSSLYPGV